MTQSSAGAVYITASREIESISPEISCPTLHDPAELREIAALDLGIWMTHFDPNVDDPHYHQGSRAYGRSSDLKANVSDAAVFDGADFDVEAVSAEVSGRSRSCHKSSWALNPADAART